jgi:hypothetical protein
VNAFYRLVLITGSASRLTRLTTRDTLTKPLRDAVRNRVLFSPEQRAALAAGTALPPARSQKDADRRRWLHTLLTCDWCAGFWWSALVVVAARTAGRGGTRAALFEIPATILTASYLLGFLAEHEEQPDNHNHGKTPIQPTTTTH